MLVSVPGLFDRQGLSIVLLGLGIVSQIMLHNTETVEIIGDAWINRPIKLGIHVESALVKVACRFEVAEIVLRGCQSVGAVRKIGGNLAARGLKPYRLVEILDGLVVIPALFKNMSQSEHCSCHRWIISPQMMLIHGQTFSRQAFRFFRLALVQS